MAATASKHSPRWSWPQDLDDTRGPSIPGAFHEDPPASPQEKSEWKHHSKSAPKSEKHYPPRTCRICLETVLPSYQPSSSNLPEILQSPPSVSYISAEPQAGRLIRPCKCKGSSRYVHEGCLQAWRHADPAYGKRNYWQCPTCGFRYRLERMQWARWISSTATQITLTISILFVAMFLLGFVADPIINFYFDPYATISSAPLSALGTKIEPILTDDDVQSWTEHFIKGLASLGLLSFIKVLLALSPWQWWNLRSSGIMGGNGRAGNGRDRLANISWIVILVGVGTFLWGVYKGVRAWSRRTLEKAGERVLDVPVDGADENEPEE